MRHVKPLMKDMRTDHMRLELEALKSQYAFTKAMSIFFSITTFVLSVILLMTLNRC